jgi:hypothetical protein
MSFVENIAKVNRDFETLEERLADVLAENARLKSAPQISEKAYKEAVARAEFYLKLLIKDVAGTIAAPRARFTEVNNEAAAATATTTPATKVETATKHFEPFKPDQKRFMDGENRAIWTALENAKGWLSYGKLFEAAKEQGFTLGRGSLRNRVCEAPNIKNTLIGQYPDQIVRRQGSMGTEFKMVTGQPKKVSTASTATQTRKPVVRKRVVKPRPKPKSNMYQRLVRTIEELLTNEFKSLSKITAQAVARGFDTDENRVWPILVSLANKGVAETRQGGTFRGSQA